MSDSLTVEHNGSFKLPLPAALNIKFSLVDSDGAPIEPAKIWQVDLYRIERAAPLSTSSLATVLYTIKESLNGIQKPIWSEDYDGLAEGTLSGGSVTLTCPNLLDGTSHNFKDDYLEVGGSEFAPLAERATVVDNGGDSYDVTWDLSEVTYDNQDIVYVYNRYAEPERSVQRIGAGIFQTSIQISPAVFFSGNYFSFLEYELSDGTRAKAYIEFEASPEPLMRMPSSIFGNDLSQIIPTHFPFFYTDLEGGLSGSFGKISNFVMKTMTEQNRLIDTMPQLWDILTAPSITLEYIAWEYGTHLVSNNPALWRKQVVNATDRWKEKGTRKGLVNRLSDCGITLHDLATYYQVQPRGFRTDSWIVTRRTKSQTILEGFTNKIYKFKLTEDPWFFPDGDYSIGASLSLFSLDIRSDSSSYWTKVPTEYEGHKILRFEQDENGYWWAVIALEKIETSGSTTDIVSILPQPAMWNEFDEVRLTYPTEPFGFFKFQRDFAPIQFDPRVVKGGYSTVKFSGLNYFSFGAPGDVFDSRVFEDISGTPTLVETTSGPSPRRGHIMFPYGTGNKFLVFGGQSEDGKFLNDTWSFDCDTGEWTEITDTTVPPVRAGATFVECNDGSDHFYIMFGGINDKGLLGDTWNWNASTEVWSLVATSVNPAPRTGASSTDVLPTGGSGSQAHGLMFGGWNDEDGYLNDLYGYDPAAEDWVLISPTGTAPTRRAAALMVPVSQGNVRILFGFDGDFITKDTNDGPDIRTNIYNLVISGTDINALTVAWTSGSKSNITLSGEDGLAAPLKVSPSAGFDPTANWSEKDYNFGCFSDGTRDRVIYASSTGGGVTLTLSAGTTIYNQTEVDATYPMVIFDESTYASTPNPPLHEKSDSNLNITSERSLRQTFVVTPISSPEERNVEKPVRSGNLWNITTDNKRIEKAYSGTPNSTSLDADPLDLRFHIITNDAIDGSGIATFTATAKDALEYDIAVSGTDYRLLANVFDRDDVLLGSIAVDSSGTVTYTVIEQIVRETINTSSGSGTSHDFQFSKKPVASNGLAATADDASANPLLVASTSYTAWGVVYDGTTAVQYFRISGTTVTFQDIGTPTNKISSATFDLATGIMAATWNNSVTDVSLQSASYKWAAPDFSNGDANPPTFSNGELKLFPQPTNFSEYEHAEIKVEAVTSSDLVLPVPPLGIFHRSSDEWWELVSVPRGQDPVLHVVQSDGTKYALSNTDFSLAYDDELGKTELWIRSDSAPSFEDGEFIEITFDAPADRFEIEEPVFLGKFEFWVTAEDANGDSTFTDHVIERKNFWQDELDLEPLLRWDNITWGADGGSHDATEFLRAEQWKATVSEPGGSTKSFNYNSFTFQKKYVGSTYETQLIIKLTDGTYIPPENSKITIEYPLRRGIDINPGFTSSSSPNHYGFGDYKHLVDHYRHGSFESIDGKSYFVAKRGALQQDDVFDRPSVFEVRVRRVHLDLNNDEYDNTPLATSEYHAIDDKNWTVKTGRNTFELWKYGGLFQITTDSASFSDPDSVGAFQTIQSIDVYVPHHFSVNWIRDRIISITHPVASLNVFDSLNQAVAASIDGTAPPVAEGDYGSEDWLKLYVLALPKLDVRRVDTLQSYAIWKEQVEANVEIPTTYPSPPIDYNTRLIDRRDEVSKLICNPLNPYPDKVTFGHVRTKVPYGETIFNIDEYDGSTRPSNDPCDIDYTFTDPCGCCPASHIGYIVSVPIHLGLRFANVQDIVNEMLPAHVIPRFVGSKFEVADYVKRPSEELEVRIRKDFEDFLIVWHLRSLADLDSFGIKRWTDYTRSYFTTTNTTNGELIDPGTSNLWKLYAPNLVLTHLGFGAFRTEDMPYYVKQGIGVVSTSGSSTNVSTTGNAFADIEAGYEILANDEVRIVQSKSDSNNIVLTEAVDWENFGNGYVWTYRYKQASSQKAFCITNSNTKRLTGLSKIADGTYLFETTYGGDPTTNADYQLYNEFGTATGVSVASTKKYRISFDKGVDIQKANIQIGDILEHFIGPADPGTGTPIRETATIEKIVNENEKIWFEFSQANGEGTVHTSGSSTTVTTTKNRFANVVAGDLIIANNVTREIQSKANDNQVTLTSTVNWDNSGDGYSWTYIPQDFLFTMTGDGPHIWGFINGTSEVSGNRRKLLNQNEAGYNFAVRPGKFEHLFEVPQDDMGTSSDPVVFTLPRNTILGAYKLGADDIAAIPSTLLANVEVEGNAGAALGDQVTMYGVLYGSGGRKIADFVVDDAETVWYENASGAPVTVSAATATANTLSFDVSSGVSDGFVKDVYYTSRSGNIDNARPQAVCLPRSRDDNYDNDNLHHIITTWADNPLTSWVPWITTTTEGLVEHTVTDTELKGTDAKIGDFVFFSFQNYLTPYLLEEVNPDYSGSEGKIVFLERSTLTINANFDGDDILIGHLIGQSPTGQSIGQWTEMVETLDMEDGASSPLDLSSLLTSGDFDDVPYQVLLEVSSTEHLSIKSATATQVTLSRPQPASRFPLSVTVMYLEPNPPDNLPSEFLEANWERRGRRPETAITNIGASSASPSGFASAASTGSIIKVIVSRAGDVSSTYLT